MPNIQIDVGQIKMRAQSIFMSPPLLKEQKYGKLIFFAQQQRHLLELSEISIKLLIEKCPTLAKVAAAFSFRSRTAKSPIINIFAKTIFGHDRPGNG